jgi:nickel-type superoxide dismutase maturation protease
MLPILESGEEILVDPHAYKRSLPKINDIVITHHPLHPEFTVVKRIMAIDEDGNCFLMGDNLRASTDSRHWGTVNHTLIEGMVTNRFS